MRDHVITPSHTGDSMIGGEEEEREREREKGCRRLALHVFVWLFGCATSLVRVHTLGAPVSCTHRMFVEITMISLLSLAFFNLGNPYLYRQVDLDAPVERDTWMDLEQRTTKLWRSKLHRLESCKNSTTMPPVTNSRQVALGL